MDQPLPEPGTVVRSRAGRDAGRYFVVLAAVDHQYLLVCDGDLRRIANPKKKKIKHLDIMPVALPIIKEKLKAGQIGQVYDAEIRKNLEGLGYNGTRRRPPNEF